MNNEEHEHEARVVETQIDPQTRSEVSMQIDAAHRYPRSVTKCIREATSLATMTPEIAESCIYSIPRDGKMITGPSVRLAEMIATSWTNLHIGSRIARIDPREIHAQSVVWDLERNVRITVEVPRSIVTRNGKRFGDSMIQTTGAAAISIALRNAVFRVIPKAFVDQVYESARHVAIGDEKTHDTKRAAVLARLQKMGATLERILARIEVANAEDITGDHLATLIGIGTAIRDGNLTVDEAFPATQREIEARAAKAAASSKPAPGRSAGSALDDMVSAHKQAANEAAPSSEEAKQEPEAEPPPPASIEVQAALEGCDKRWGGDAAAELIASWSPEQRADAYAWAMEPDKLEQPAFVKPPAKRRKAAAG